MEVEIFGAILKDLKILSFAEKEYEHFFSLSLFFFLSLIFLYKTNFTHGFENSCKNVEVYWMKILENILYIHII